MPERNECNLPKIQVGCFFSQADDAGLVMDDGVPPTAADLETEQLISEIDQLTSRALEETHQWSSLSPAKGATASTSEAVDINRNNNHDPLVNPA